MPIPGLTNGKETLWLKATGQSPMQYGMESAIPSAEAGALPAIKSDHSPILLSFSTKWVKRKKGFRFEAYWLDDSKCKKVVKEAWSTQHNPQLDIVSKIRKMAAGLETWSRKKFSNAARLVDTLKKRLTELTNSDKEESHKDEVQSLTESIENRWRQEEMYWYMRSRIN